MPEHKAESRNPFAFLCGKNVLVTGASGFLGRHLLPKLIQAGAKTSCFLRPASSLDFLPQPLRKELRIFRGDCASGQGLEDALSGQQILIHLAALLFGLGWQDYLRANSEAARRIVKASPEGLERIVLISSLAAAGPCAIAPGLDEQALPRPVSAYGWSKLLTEQIFQAAYQERLVILRPPIIYGSGDRGLLPLFKSAARGIGVSPGLGRSFPVSLIHAADAAQAILLAAMPKARGIYHLDDGEPKSMSAFCKAVGLALGREKTLVLELPLPLMGASAALSTAFAAGLGRLRQFSGASMPRRAPNWNLDKYREACAPGWLATAAKIRAELGFAPQVRLASGLAEAVAGYRQEGWL